MLLRSLLSALAPYFVNCIKFKTSLTNLVMPVFVSYCFLQDNSEKLFISYVKNQAKDKIYL